MSKWWIAAGGALAGTLLILWLRWPVPITRDDMLHVDINLTNGAGAGVTAACSRTKPCVVPISLYDVTDGPPIALDLRPAGGVIKAKIVTWVGEHGVAPAADWSLVGHSFRIELDQFGAGSGGTDIYVRTKRGSGTARKNEQANAIISDLVFRRPLPLTTLRVSIRSGRL